MSTCRSTLDLCRSREMPLCSLVEKHRCQSLHPQSEIALKLWSPRSQCLKTAVGGFVHCRRRWILPHWSTFLPVLRHVPLRLERSRCKGWLVCRVMKSCSSWNLTQTDLKSFSSPSQYPIVAGKHDVSQPTPDGSCGVIAGLEVQPAVGVDPTFDHSKWVSAKLHFSSLGRTQFVYLLVKNRHAKLDLYIM